MIKLENISKLYKDKQILKNAYFTAEAGQIVLLMGKSGVGKSTLLEIIAGLKIFEEGKYLYYEEEIFPKNDSEMSLFRNQRIGYIPQDFALIEDYTVYENLILPFFL